MSKIKVVLSVSGSLGYTTLKRIDSYFQIAAILTNKSSTDIIEYGKAWKIPTYVGNPRGGKGLSFLIDRKAQCFDYLISINYLYLIEADLIELPRKKAINIHGSLLPKYRGRTPHVWAIINGEKETGATVHCISDGCDEGDIVVQKVIPIDPNDTGQKVLESFRGVYPDLVLKSIELLESSSFTPTKQDNSLATYFGKRTPSDGAIDWSWGADRVINWVRAQASPYPGAFSFSKFGKVIIHECHKSALGFSSEESNGLVKLINSKTYVKTPNSMIELIQFESESYLIDGEILKGIE